MSRLPASLFLAAILFCAVSSAFGQLGNATTDTGLKPYGYLSRRRYRHD